jgi:hypothetical protein
MFGGQRRSWKEKGRKLKKKFVDGWKSRCNGMIEYSEYLTMLWLLERNTHGNGCEHGNGCGSGNVL